MGSKGRFGNEKQIKGKDNRFLCALIPDEVMLLTISTTSQALKSCCLILGQSWEKTAAIQDLILNERADLAGVSETWLRE